MPGKESNIMFNKSILEKLDSIQSRDSFARASLKGSFRELAEGQRIITEKLDELIKLQKTKNNKE